MMDNKVNFVAPSDMHGRNYAGEKVPGGSKSRMRLWKVSMWILTSQLTTMQFSSFIGEVL